MNFSNIIGHDNFKTAVKSMLATERFPYSILFTGPEGIGKRLSACILAAALNCRSPNEDGACGECVSCRQLASGNHPQVYFIGSLKNEEELKIELLEGKEIVIQNLIPPNVSGARTTVKLSIEQMREATRLSTLKALGDGKKIFIFDDIADASIPALNSLLKVLEEPSPQTYFFLITNREVSLLQTVLSRCRRMEFLPLDRESMKNFAESRLSGEDISEEMFDAASGSPGRLTRYIKASKVRLQKIPPEKFFSEVKSWYKGSDPEEKILMLLEVEAAAFRENPNPEGYRRVTLIEKALADLKMNASTDLTISNLFLKLGAVDL
ncbi:MAG: hypothetical protein GX817_00125 [Elusimicrobia bacterium]|nr:hypothetical protein [Elusimicrobiota bacterium]